MSVFFDTRETKIVDPAKVSIGPSSGFFENLNASFAETEAIGQSVSQSQLVAEEEEDRKKTIEELTGKSYGDAVRPFRDDQMGPGGGFALTEAGRDTAVERLKATLDENVRGRILTRSQMRARAKERALEKVHANAEVKARGRDFFGSAGQFFGAAGAALLDPGVFFTLPFGATSGARIPVAMGVEAAIVGVTEGAVIQPAVQKWRAKLGLPSGFSEGAKNTLIGATAAAGVVGGLMLAGRAISKLSDKELVQAHKEILRDTDIEETALRTRLEEEVEIAETNPWGRTPVATEEHQRRLAETSRAFQESRQPELPFEENLTLQLEPTPGSRVMPEPRDSVGHALEPEAAGGQLYRFEPDDIVTDAKRFQFKEGGDDAGVTDRLAGVDRWDPTRAGIIFVWEDAAGKRFIADGHQRLGLAKRLKDQNPLLNGFLLREADGVTAQEARAWAAAKNIAEGTGTPIDAAKVLRDRPEVGLDLPPNSALVRDAEGLARLSEDAFGMVVNERVNANHASIVGRLAPDKPELHSQVLDILNKNKPKSAVEAESMARDALSAPQVKAVQEDLFGKVETAEILYKERAKIIAAAARRLKKDRAAFNTLVKEEARLTEAGNILATDTNVARAKTDGEILQTIQKLARRKGPIADALGRAAEDLKGGRSLNSVTSRFVDDARRAGETLDTGGREAGGTRRGGKGRDDGGSDEGNGSSGPAGDGGGPAPAESTPTRSAAPRRAGDTGGDLTPAARPEPARAPDDEAVPLAPPPGQRDLALPDNAGTRDLNEIRPLSDELAPDDAGAIARAAQDEILDDPLSPAARRELELNEADLAREIQENGDFEVPVGVDGETRKASDLLNELARERRFAEQLGTICE